jgi:hypothetical protein
MLSAMDGRELDRVRTVSLAVFGAKHRLPVALEVGRGPAKGIYAAAIAGLVKTSDSQAGNELQRLADAGLLKAQTPAVGERGRPRQPFTRRQSKYWELANALARERLPR